MQKNANLHDLSRLPESSAGWGFPAAGIALAGWPGLL
jgi:hypothetical protein